MNPDIKAQWVAALRSGEYKQGRRVLNRGDEYCCLGVLCELAVEAGEIGKRASVGANGEGITRYGPDGDGHLLPDEVTTWSAIDTMRIRGYELFQYNDGYSGSLRPHSFSEIADLIEEHL